MRGIVLALVVLATPAWPQEPDLGLKITRAELEDLIYKAKIGGPIVAIMDGCREEVGAESGSLYPSVLGQKVSETLRVVLRPTRFPIKQIDYAALKERLREEGVSASEVCDRQVAAWAARMADGLIVILPRLRQRNDGLVVQLDAIRISTGEVVGEIFRRVPADKELLASFMALPEGAERRAGPAAEQVAPPHAVKAGEDGVGEPRCLYCPNPFFTDAAVTAKFGGTLSLRVVVSEEGSVTYVEVVQGAPYGLTRKAIEAVKSWRFDPARNRDWKPVAVWTLVEVNFRQY